MLKNRKIKAFYNTNQVCQEDIQSRSYSKSPLKPMLLMQYLTDNGFDQYIEVESNFEPFSRFDFQMAHTESYVSNFFEGKGNCGSNSLPWSSELVESVRYTNASLYNAIRYAVHNPSTVTLSPTSGFHHAGPNSGQGFCTFSGQVIAAVKIFEETGKKAAFLDLDGHFGNSIEDSRSFDAKIDEAIPFNINPRGSHGAYIQDFKRKLAKLADAFFAGDVHYVVWCHGADSHEWDQLGSQCSTEEWIECSKIFYEWVNEMKDRTMDSIPVTLALFGGYRDDDYDSVLSLHASDLRECINRLCGGSLEYETSVKPAERHYRWIDQALDETPSHSVPTVSEAVQEDVWSLQSMSAKEIVDMIEGALDIRIRINPKNKKRVIKKAYKILIENDYV